MHQIRKKHFYFKIYDANPEIIPDAVGQTEEKYYIYGIQKTSPKASIDESKYIKQVRRMQL